VLEELRIADLGVIEDAVLPLGPGFTVLTGETGAGKTMLVTALLLLFGERADTAQVRGGAAQATVDGRIQLNSELPAADGRRLVDEIAERVGEVGGSLDDESVLLLRRVVASGRSRAFVGGAPAPVGVLGQLAERLVTVHGQSDQLRLARPAEQRGALDRFAGLDLGPYRHSFERWREAVERLADRVGRIDELRREAELLDHGLTEIRRVAPLADEDVELAAEAARLAHADGLRMAARSAHDLLLGDPDDPAGDAPDVSAMLAQAVRALNQQAAADPALASLAERAAGLAATAADLGSELSAYRDGLDADPGRLAEIEGRRAELISLTRRYGTGHSLAGGATTAGTVAQVLAWAEAAQQRLSELDVSDEALNALRTEVVDSAAQCAAQAQVLTGRRRVEADRLADAITAELAGLAMPNAQLGIDVRARAAGSGALPLMLTPAGGPPTEVGASADGVDEVEFLLRSHPDAAALPLGRGASGGELSRVMLAVEVCLAGTEPVPTLVFDEVDAGVGGRAAVEVGRRLAALAEGHQVIAVTHLAQVAAFADRHIVVDRPMADGAVNRSDVRVVEGEQRLVELARMLAGTDSATAREHAAELLSSAQRPSPGRTPTA
jgi:DNA repair protein RecN (Recombination protein N)